MLGSLPSPTLTQLHHHEAFRKGLRAKRRSNCRLLYENTCAVAGLSANAVTDSVTSSGLAIGRQPASDLDLDDSSLPFLPSSTAITAVDSRALPFSSIFACKAIRITSATFFLGGNMANSIRHLLYSVKGIPADIPLIFCGSSTVVSNSS